MAQRIELITPGQIANADATAAAPGAPAPTVVQVPAVVTGTADKVGWAQKLKSSYKAIVACLGALITLLSQLTPIVPEKYRGIVGGVLVALTAISTFMVKNQAWVEGL